MQSFSVFITNSLADVLNPSYMLLWLDFSMYREIFRFIVNQVIDHTIHFFF